jgi:hypothetical protein
MLVKKPIQSPKVPNALPCVAIKSRQSERDFDELDEVAIDDDDVVVVVLVVDDDVALPFAEFVDDDDEGINNDAIDRNGKTKNKKQNCTTTIRRHLGNH